MRTAFLHITSLCGNHCKHCFANSGSRGFHASYHKISQRIKKLKGFVSRISINGGEPFLHPDLLSIAGECLDANVEVSVVTSGLNVSKSSLVKLSKYPVVLCVSVDGYDSKQHDALRSNGSFEKALSVLNMAAELGIKTRVITVVNKYNCVNPEKLVCFLQQLPVRQIVLFYLMPWGRAINNRQLYLDFDEWSSFLHSAERAVIDSGPVILVEPAYAELFQKSLVAQPCSVITKKFLTITVKGDVYPCPGFCTGDAGYMLGNIDNDNTAHIINNAIDLQQFAFQDNQCPALGKFVQHETHTTKIPRCVMHWENLSR